MEQLLQARGVDATAVGGGIEALLGTEEFIGVWVGAGLVRGSQERTGSEQGVTSTPLLGRKAAWGAQGCSQESELCLAGQSQTSTTPAWGSAITGSS